MRADAIMLLLALYFIAPGVDGSAALTATNEADCLKHKGKWFTVTLTGKATLDIVDVEKQKTILSFTKDGQFCLDYIDKHYAPCYDLKTSSTDNSDGWKLYGKSKREDKDVIDKIDKKGKVKDDVKMLCGRFFKKLGKFSNKQLSKMDAGKYSSKAGRIRGYTKVEAKAKSLNLYKPISLKEKKVLRRSIG